MAGWTVHDIAPDVRVRVVRPAPPLAGAVDAEVGRLWQAAQMRTGGRLFNGRVFSADRITPRLITGHWTEFRRVVAQMARPELHAALGIRPLAVGGVVVGPDGVVFARRPADAVYQPGEWQMPPAGSVDDSAARADGAVDVLAQFFAELGEELGLPAAAVRDPTPLAIVEHAEDGVGSHVLDLGIAVRTDLDAAALRACHAAGGDGEYAALEIVPVAELAAFLARAGGTINRQAPVFLRRAGLLAA